MWEINSEGCFAVSYGCCEDGCGGRMSGDDFMIFDCAQTAALTGDSRSVFRENIVGKNPTFFRRVRVCFCRVNFTLSHSPFQTFRSVSLMEKFVSFHIHLKEPILSLNSGKVY